MKIAYLTAGAAGMYCGSCLHDNTLARALTRLGCDVSLVPAYTPIRTDEQNVSVDRVFFGGINVYLQQKIPLFRALPAFLDRFLDAPWLIRRATAGATAIDPRELGALTVSMLQGLAGRQRKEVRRLADWLAAELRPDVVVLTNMLLAGCVPELNRRLGAPVLVTLQGDDIFLRELTEPYQSRALELIRGLTRDVAGFLVHSRYYAETMGPWFGIPPEKLLQAPLGIDVDDFPSPTDEPPPEPRAVGYLARLAPEKGLHVLVEAFLRLRARPGFDDVRLRVAGWLGAHRRDYAEAQWAKLRAAGLGDAYEYVGEVDRAGKAAFLRSVRVLSTPTTYREPKGLYVLEALAAGVPVVQPAHGAFPELLADLGGGLLCEPENPDDLAAKLAELLADEPRRRALARQGCEAVRTRRSAPAMAEATRDLLARFVRK